MAFRSCTRLKAASAAVEPMVDEQDEEGEQATRRWIPRQGSLRAWELGSLFVAFPLSLSSHIFHPPFPCCSSPCNVLPPSYTRPLRLSSSPRPAGPSQPPPPLSLPLALSSSSLNASAPTASLPAYALETGSSHQGQPSVACTVVSGAQRGGEFEVVWLPSSFH